MNQPPNWPPQGFQPGAQPGFQSPPIQHQGFQPGAQPGFQSPPIGGGFQQPPQGMPGGFPPGMFPQQGMPGQPMPGQPMPTAQMPGQGPNFNANPFAGLVPGEPAMTRYPYLESVSPVQPATYKLALAKVRCHRARNGKTFYIIESDVKESNNPQRPAGTRCSAMIDMNNQDMWRRHVIAFLASVYGYEPGTIVKDSPVTPWDGKTWEQVATASVHDSNPLAGQLIGCVTSTITVQKTGKPFTLNEWRPHANLIVPPVQLQQAFPTYQPQMPQQSYQMPQQGYQPPAQGVFPPPGFAPPGMPPQSAPGYQQPPQGGYQQAPQQAPQGYPQQGGYPPPGYGG